MGARLARARARLRAAPVRGLTLTAGVALGGVMLVGAALFGGPDLVGGDAPPPEAAPERLGPLTAVQPELRRALLTGLDLAADGASPGAPAGEVPPATTAPARRTRADEPPAGEPCRILFEDPAELPALRPLPSETTSRHTAAGGGSMLDQMLGVFTADDAPAAYGQLRETATGCDEFPAVLDGSPVTVVLRELAAADRRESAGGAADDAYAMGITVHREAGTLTGWLALDRVGPVVSVLRQLGPEGAPASDPAQTRRTALGKLRPLLHALDRRMVTGIGGNAGGGAPRGLVQEP